MKKPNNYENTQASGDFTPVQREALAHTRAELSRALEQAREAREKQGRMYQVLGITAGAFLVILLL